MKRSEKRNLRKMERLIKKLEALTAPLYVVRTKMATVDRTEFTKQWVKLGAHRYTNLLFMPSDIQLEPFPKDKLDFLIKQLTELKGRLPNENCIKP